LFGFSLLTPLRFIYKEKDERQIEEKARKEAIKGRNIFKEAEFSREHEHIVIL